ncbi:MAG: C39 family peptidase [Patescibacteria group bacterium]
MKNEKLQSKIKKCFLIKILAKARIFLLFVICYLLFVKPVFAQFKTFFGDVAGICEYWKKVFDFSVAAAGILTVLTLMFGGLYYLVSGGDKGKIGKAKEIMSAGIAGFILILLGWTIFNVVAPQLNQCKIEVEMITLSEEEVEKVPENLCAGIPEEKLFLTQKECEETGGENKTKCEGYCAKGKLETDEKKSEEEKWCCKKEKAPEIKAGPGCIQNPISYKQGGGTPWGGKIYGNCSAVKENSMAYTGCGPTTIAMVLSTFGIPKTPGEIADEIVINGWRTCGQGTSSQAIYGILQKYGLTVQAVDIEGAKRALLAGETVIGLAKGPKRQSGTTGAFTDNAHYIFLTCYNEDTKNFSVLSSSKKGTGDFDESIVKSDVASYWAINR